MPPPDTAGRKGPEQVLEVCGGNPAALRSRSVKGPSMPSPATFSSMLIELGCFRSIGLGPPLPENLIVTGSCCADTPAAAGEVLSLFARGLGPVKPGVDPGQPFPSSPLATVNSPVRSEERRVGKEC